LVVGADMSFLLCLNMVKGTIYPHALWLVFITLLYVLGRISYAEWLLQELIQSYPAEIKLHVMYDIACTLKKYMEVRSILVVHVYTFMEQPLSLFQKNETYITAVIAKFSCLWA
jgi:hypothetical protein